MSKKVKVILTISIILNILLIGLVGGHMVKRMAHHGPRASMLEKVTQHLPEEKRALVEKKLEAFEASRKQDFEEGKKHSDKLMEILSAPEFNIQEYKKTAAKLQRVHAGKRFERTVLMGEIAQSLSHEERLQMVEQMQERRKKWRDRKDRR